MVYDARERTKVYLDTYITSGNLTKDDGATYATWMACYANPEYPLVRVFAGDEKNVDVVFAIGEPETGVLVDFDKAAYGYLEHVPVTVFCVDKTGVTGTKMKWKAEAELRRILETYPLGSVRTLERRRDRDRDVGSTVLYGTEFTLSYRRDLT